MCKDNHLRKMEKENRPKCVLVGIKKNRYFYSTVKTRNAVLLKWV
jgi:hypothetical protein